MDMTFIFEVKCKLHSGQKQLHNNVILLAELRLHY